MFAGRGTRQAEPLGCRGEPAGFDDGCENPCIFKSIHRRPKDCQPIVDNLFRAAPIINAIFPGMGEASAATKSRKRSNPMSKFVVAPHFRLHEWVAEEKGYFAAEGLDYEFRETMDSSAGSGH